MELFRFRPPTLQLTEQELQVVFLAIPKRMAEHSWRLFLIERGSQVPYYCNVEGTAFENGMRQLARFIVETGAPNLYEVGFTMSKAGCRDFKVLSAEDRKAFGYAYELFLKTKAPAPCEG